MIGETLLSTLWNFMQNQINNMILDLLKILLTLVTKNADSFWDQSVVKLFLNFSQWANMLVFGVSVLFMLFDLAEEITSGKDVDYSLVFTSTVKAYIFCRFNCLLAVLSLQLSNIITDKLDFNISSVPDDLFSTISGSVGEDISFSLLLAIVALIATCAFFYMTVVRYGAMFIQILSSSFYISDVLRGDTTSLGAWLRQRIAIAGTYLFQFITFYLGLYFLTSRNLILCAICWAGMASAGSLLQKFGYSTGVRGMFSTVSSLAGKGISLMSKV